MISSGVAPALSAPWMCRRVPGAYMWVMDASKAMLINSMNLGVKRPLLYTLAPKAKNSIGPGRGKLVERIPRRVPLTDRSHRIARRSLRFRPSRRLHSRRLHLLKQDRRAQAARMNGQPNATFQDEKNLIARRACIERTRGSDDACLLHPGSCKHSSAQGRSAPPPCAAELRWSMGSFPPATAVPLPWDPTP